MANVAHSTLTGADLHEPKGISSATSGTVYVANGSGSGTWSSASSALSITGMIADFASPNIPTGWYECNGAAKNRVTDSALFSALTVQQNGTRTNGSAIITGLANTGSIAAGYFFGGTGIPTGTTVLTVDSATQVTLSAAASSSGTANTIASPWALGDGSTTFNIPNISTAGRYRRSRLIGTYKIGDALASDNLAHGHAGSTTGNFDSDHKHTYSGATGVNSVDHTHSYGSGAVGGPSGGGSLISPGSTNITTGESQQHTHPYSGTSDFADRSLIHNHTVTIASNGGSESRPVTLVVLTCIKN